MLFKQICLASCALLCLLVNSSNAESPLDVLPKIERIAGIKTPEQFYGFAIGSRHLRHDQVLDYLQYLADESDRVEIQHYGKTHGGRPLLVCIVSAPNNIQQLEQIRNRRPRLATGKFQALGNELLVMSMGYCVHGDEASGINAVPLVAYHLATANDADTLNFLEQSVALIDPALNPDGTDRFANWANENRGQIASASPTDREHNQQWPGGRTNYYYFDLNRDWLPVVHPESQGRIKLFHAWKPNVVLDFHEMGGNSSYFFQPGELKSINPFSPKENLKITQQFAKEHIAAMDKSGELFYSEENFDDFYIGKGSTYPDLQGSVGILFEQASTRGLRYANKRVARHFQDTVANQFRLTLSSITAAQKQREPLLKLQNDFFNNALKAAQNHPIKAYVLHGSPSRVLAAAKTLKQHTVRVYRPEKEITIAGKSFDAANVAIIPLDQPQHFLIRSVMEKVESFERNVFYDVSTWHFPSAFDIDAFEYRNDVPEAWLAKTDFSVPIDESKVQEADFDKIVAWAIPPVELQVPKLVVVMQQMGAQFRVTTLPCKAGEFSLPTGTYVMLKQPNRTQWAKLSKSIVELSRRESVTCCPIQSGSTVQGPDLGSDTLIDIPKCKPLLVLGTGTTSYSAGSLWYYLDYRLRQPVDKVEVDRLSGAELQNYTCVLLPEGSYSTLSDSAVEQLDTYVKNGGTVIAIGSAIGTLQRKKLIRGSESTSESTEGSKDVPARKRFADADDEAALESIAGAFFEVSVDDSHPLAFGFPDSKIPVFRTTTRRYAAPANSYQLIAKYESVIAGYVSDRNRNQLKSSAAAWVSPSGSGRYILIADNPVFRGYVRGAEKFLVNAMLIGPSFKLPSGGGGDGQEDDEL
ncbi:MAG: M14 family metallopeptidase [Pirellulales bacterium]